MASLSVTLASCLKCSQIWISLTRVEIGGATDLGQSFRDAAAVVAGKPRGAVLYLGDGLPTTGALDATAFWLGLLCLFFIEVATVLTNELFDYESDLQNQNF